MLIGAAASGGRGATGGSSGRLERHLQGGLFAHPRGEAARCQRHGGGDGAQKGLEHDRREGVFLWRRRVVDGLKKGAPFREEGATPALGGVAEVPAAATPRAAATTAARALLVRVRAVPPGIPSRGAQIVGAAAAAAATAIAGAYLPFSPLPTSPIHLLGAVLAGARSLGRHNHPWGGWWLPFECVLSSSLTLPLDRSSPYLALPSLRRPSPLPPLAAVDGWWG